MVSETGFTQLMNEADRLAGMGQPVQAFECFEKALHDCPQDPNLIAAAGDFAQRHNLLDEAARLYGAAAALAPSAEVFRIALAGVNQQLGRYVEAVDILRDATEKDPTNPELWSKLGVAVSEMGDLENGLIFLKEAKRLAPKHAGTMANLGEIYNRAGQLEKAERYLKKAAKAMPDDPQVRLNLAMVLLRRGKLKQGWHAYEVRRDPKIKTADLYEHNLPEWQGEKVGPGELLVCLEQGVGDHLLFANCFKDLEQKAPGALVECEARLIPLFQRSFPSLCFVPMIKSKVLGKGIHHYGWLEDLERKPKYCFYLGSLMKMFRGDLTSFPDHKAFIKPDPALKEVWKERVAALGPGKKVGLSWRSGMLGPQRIKYYLAVEDLAPLFGLDGVEFVNLQYDESTPEIETVKQKFGTTLHHFMDLNQRDDFENTAAMISNLDLVISVGTTARVLAGALGVETWLIGSYARPWTSLGTDHEPFVPSTKCIQPETWGDWDWVVKTVTQRLKTLADDKN